MGGRGKSGGVNATEPQVLAEANEEKAEPLEMEAEGDTLMGEQTWPTAAEFPELEGDEMGMDEDETKADGHVKRFPKGMTDAQKAWFDFDDQEGHVFGDVLNEDEMGFGGEDYEEVDMRSLRKQDDDAEALHVADKASLEEMRWEELERRRAREKEEREFPDEVDTPLETPARQRFARYRALRSFRTSPWHRHEALPPQYARIHAFQDFRQVQKAVLDEMAEAEKVQNRGILEGARTTKTKKRGRSKSTASSAVDDDAMLEAADDSAAADKAAIELDDGEAFVPVGTYVALEVVDIPEAAIEAAVAAANGLRGTGVPLCISSLLPHENRLSVVHFTVQRTVQDTNRGVVHSSVPIASKDTLRFVCGFRQWTAKPLFSEVASGAGEKQRYERFLPAGFACASTLGPVCYSPCPVLVFRDEKDDDGYVTTQLVGTGQVDAVDPDRLIIKRILLTGYPVKVHKRSATVKYMFFNTPDVRWFKPAELHTKLGMTGHIKESLGEQGLMKCVFNKRIKQHDTVCLPLYKRVYPKFPEGDKVDVL